MDRITQSVAKRVVLKGYLSADHISPATGKTIAVVISKNGAAFGNPNAGATNATEIGNGWYYVDLDTTDTGTAGPLVVRGTEADTDPIEIAFSVEVAVATASALTTVEGKVDTVDTVVDAINAKTTNLPSDPADQSLVIDATTAIYDRIGAPAGASIAEDIANSGGSVDFNDMFDLAAGVETGLTLRQYLRLAASVLLGKMAVSGGGTTNTFRDKGDTKNRVVATVDPVTGARSAITYDAS